MENQKKSLIDALNERDESKRIEAVEKILGPAPLGCEREYFTRDGGTSLGCYPRVEKQNCVRIYNCPDSSDNRTVCGDPYCADV